ncbi:MAG: hypothetical protein U9N78_08140 [Actinomycetota bacterium]|nr:hypothetical protein [Actinomycetota bacterium]
MRVRLVAFVLALVLVGTACSSDNSESDPASSDPEATNSTLQASTDTAVPETEAAETTTTSESGDNALAAAAAGGASATLTLENGETYTFNILCALETQESASQEILFTVVSYDDPISLDVTQFGAESLGGAASLTLYDSETFDDVWGANTLHGAELTLELSGDTVTGHGVFLPGEDRIGPGVAGEFEAHC